MKQLDQEIKTQEATTQETTTNQTTEAKILGTILIILSGVILYLDKIFSALNITVQNLHGWPAQDTYIWALTQTISPVLIMVGMHYKAFKLALLVPLYCYVLQFYFVLDSTLTVDKFLTNAYVFGTMAIIVAVVRVVQLWLKKLKAIKSFKIQTMQTLIDIDDKLLKKQAS